MVPEGSFPLGLNISSKGLSWVDLMCQKFEVICEGVDKSPPGIVKETTRFIDQISTVGANMQKFCSDFMDDILPPITEIDDNFFCDKFSSSEDLNLTDKSYPGENIDEFSLCEDVDKNSSALVQKVTKSIADQRIVVGENGQKFSSAPMEDMSTLVKKNDEKCPSPKLSANVEEDLEIADPEQEMDETLNRENVDSSNVDWEADVMDQLNASCIYEENVSAKSAKVLSQARTTENYSEVDASERAFEDNGSLQERNCLHEFAEPLISHNNIPLKLDGELLSNRTGVVGVTDQGGNGTIKGSTKLEAHPSHGEKMLLEDELMEVVLEEYENVEQNLPDEDVERVLSNAEPYTAISSALLKEGNFKKSLYLAVKEKEQAACWHGNLHAQDRKDIDMSSSYSFVNITDSCRWPDVDYSDSEWELL